MKIKTNIYTYSWLYRILPSVMHEPFERFQSSPDFTQNFESQPPNPSQVRDNDTNTDFHLI